MEEAKKISVVVAAYNSEKTISATIEALLSQNWPEDDLEIIIADDGSTDRTAEIVKKYPVKYLYQKNKGPAAARNYGWKSAQGKIVCFTDSDCVPEKKWVSKIIKGYTSDDIAGLGGSYDIANPDSLNAVCIHEEIAQRHLKIPEEANFLGSFNVSYRRTVLQQVGGFDESYTWASAEDNELAYRIKKKGYKLIFNGDIKVAHYHPESIIRYLKSQYRHGIWRVKLYRDHPDMASGDNYAGILDFVRPPLALLTIVTLPFIYFPFMAFLLCFLLILQLILQLSMPFSIVKRTKNIKYFYLTFIVFLRDYVRGVGMIMGIWKFRRRCT